MDREAARAIRALKASGNFDAVIKALLNDARLSSLQAIAYHCSILMRDYNVKMVRKCFELPDRELLAFKLIICGSHQDLEYPVTSIEKSTKSISFTSQIRVAEPLSYGDLSLTGMGYNFGRFRTEGNYLSLGETFNETIKLEVS